MTLKTVLMGDVLRLERQRVDICPDAEYAALGMRSFGRGIFHHELCTGDQLTRLPHFTFPANALALSNIKAWEGAIAVTADTDLHAVASSRFLFYVPHGEDVDVRYLRYYFLSPKGLRQIGQASPGSADRNRTLSMKSFERIGVEVPSLNEQRRIADKLDSAMSRLSRIGAMRKHVDRLAQLYADGAFQVERTVKLERILRPSNDLVEVDPEETYRTAGILNRGRGLFRRPPISGSETKYPRFNRLRAGHFVYSKLFGWEGSLAVVPPELEGVHVSHEFPTFEIDRAVATVEYITHLARWPGLHEALRDKGSGMGSRRQRVNVDRLLATEVPLPSLPDQQRIARRLTLVRQAVVNGAAQTTQISALKPALLEAAFSGRL